MSTQVMESTTIADLLIFDPRLAEEREYWLDHRLLEIEPVRLCFDRRRAGKYAGVRGTHEFNMAAEICLKLAELTNHQPFLSYAVMLAALKICLFKYNERNPVIVGSPARKRENSAQQPVNVLAISSQLGDQMSFRQLLISVRQSLLEAYARQRYPFEQLMRDLGLKNNDDNGLIFNVVLTMDSIHCELPPLNNDITIILQDKHDSLKGTIAFDEGLFTGDGIVRFIDQFMSILRQGLADTNTILADMTLLTEQEKQQIVYGWNDTNASRANLCIHQHFEEQVERTPNAVAIAFQNEQLTYRQLNQKSNQLAHHLRRLGVGPESHVGHCFERSVNMLVSLMAILKTGAAYVPLDPQYPKERLSFLLADAGISVLLADEQANDCLPEHEAEHITLRSGEWIFDKESVEDVRSGAVPANLAYVIYTSGSTGTPKGVLIDHAGVCNAIESSIVAFGITPSSRIAQIASLSFDSSVMEIFMALFTGASIWLIDRKTLLSTTELAHMVRHNSINVMVIPPALRPLLPADELSGLETVIVGGETCTPETLAKWTRPNRRLFNCYAPTETTIYSTFKELSVEDHYMPPIGRPIQNLRVYVLDEHLEIVPIGVAGELHVGGIGLARGYLDRPDVTAEKFIPDPYSGELGFRLYKTGDRAFYMADGNLGFLGRLDDQVKVRGFRIEPGEIEAALFSHSAIREVVVIAREDAAGERRLVAYIQPNDQQPVTVNDLRRHLQDRLPDYMIPSAFVTVESFPKTPNGKLDRRSLPAPGASRPELEAGFVKPSSDTEEMLAGIWTEILGVKAIGIHDNFFDLGGRSLNATQVMSRIKKAVNVELAVQNLFDTPTIAGLAATVDRSLEGMRTITTPESPIQRIPRDAPLPLSFAQQRIWFLQQMIPSEIYNGPIAVAMTGPLNVPALEQSLNQIIKRHEVMRTAYQVVDGNPLQVIVDPVSCEITQIDLRSLRPEERQRKVESLSLEEAKHPFDLTQVPLLRATLVHLAQDQYVLLLTIHHILFDRWSLGVFVKEMELFYEAFCGSKEPSLPELAIQYADFACWQRQWAQGRLLEDHLAYWKKQLANLPELELPVDFVPPQIPTYRGRLANFLIAPDLAERLRKLSVENGVTLFMTLLAAYKVLFHRYTGQEDIVVGAPIANRNRIEVEPLIGFFVNSQVLRTSLAGKPTFREVLRRVRQTTLQAHAYQDVPFEKLVDELRPKGYNSVRNPLFRTAFSLQNTPAPEFKLPSMTIKPFNRDSLTAKFDLTTTFLDTEEGLTGVIEYSTDIFKTETIAAMIERYQAILEMVAQDPDIDLIDIPLESKDISPALQLSAEQFDFVGGMS